MLLDVVFTDAPYGKFLEKDIAGHPMAFSGAGGVVRIPSVEGLLGDKLTAISPKTMGIRLEQDRTPYCLTDRTSQPEVLSGLVKIEWVFACPVDLRRFLCAW